MSSPSAATAPPAAEQQTPQPAATSVSEPQAAAAPAASGADTSLAAAAVTLATAAASAAPSSSSPTVTAAPSKTPPRTTRTSAAGSSPGGRSPASSGRSSPSTPGTSAATSASPRSSGRASPSAKGKERDTGAGAAGTPTRQGKRSHPDAGAESAGSPGAKAARTSSEQSPKRRGGGNGGNGVTRRNASSPRRTKSAAAGDGAGNGSPRATAGAELDADGDTSTGSVDDVGDISGGSASSTGSNGGLASAFQYPSEAGAGLHISSTVSRGSYHQCGTARRVKVYELQGETWHDRGTGFCAGVYDEGRDEALLVACGEESCAVIPLENETEEGAPGFILVVTPTLEGENVLLKSTVVREDVYQRQQDTLVVWTEPTGVDMALSFQEAEGCSEIWEFLTEVQKHFILNGTAMPAGQEGALSDSPPLTPNAGSSPVPGPLHEGDSLVMADGGAFYLPEPQMDNLELVEVTLKDAASRGPHAREKVAAWMLKTGFLNKLLPVFSDAEDLEQLTALHHLCTIMQATLSLNDHALLETILQDEVFLGVVGMLEYDPEFPTLKANYRDFLTKTTKFRSVVEIVEPHILAKIHQTYRLSYLKDVILARVLDDPMFSVLNSFIFFHQVDIVGFCTSCEAFLVPLFALWNEGYQLTPAMILKRRQTEKEALAETSEEQKAQREERKRDGMILIQQLCAMGKQVQLPARISLYRSLVDWGLLRVLEWALQQNSAETRLRNAAAEVLLTIIEYDANSVRAHILVQAEHKLSTPLSTLLIDSLHAEQDLGLKTQMAEAMRVLFDTGIEGAASAGNAVVQSLAAAAAAAAGSKAKDEADRFLTFIYESDIERLFSPLSTLPNFREIAAGTHVDLQPRARSALFGHLCDLLCYVMANHTFRSQYFVITSEIAISVAALLAAREKHMRLAALRFFRACLARNNQFINRHLVKIELLGAVLDVVEREERRDNLVASAVLDFFFHIRKENMKPLISHVMEKYGERVRKLAQLPTVGPGFAAFVLQHEKNVEPVPEASTTAEVSSAEAERERRQRDLERRGANRATMDSDEESYFNDDDEEEAANKIAAAAAQAASAPTGDASPAASSSAPARPGLVAYADDDGDAEPDPEVLPAASKLPSIPDEADTSGSADASEPLKMPEKRRRGDEESEEDDLIGRLAKRKSIAKEEADAEEGGFLREKSVTPAPEAASSAAAQSGGAKKISLGLSSSSKKMAAAAATAAAPSEVSPATDS